MHHNFHILLMTFFMSFALKSCSSIDMNPVFENVDMRVNHFKQTGIGVSPQLVYLVQENDKIGGEQWNYFYDDVQGFEYEPGYIYDLKIRKETVQDPPQDASAFRYILISVRSKQKVPENESFEIKLKWGGNNFVTRSNDTFYLLDEYVIDCADLCGDLSESLQNNEEVTGAFTHGNEEVIKLISIQ